MTPGLKRAVWILNTLGFIFYLVWLSTLDARQTLRSQDGILFYLPCVPFLFVYMLLVPSKSKPPPGQDKSGPPSEDVKTASP
jgi:hypothetical protein